MTFSNLKRPVLSWAFFISATSMHEGKVWKKTRDDAEWELPPDETEMIQSTRTHGLPWGPLLGLYLRVKVTLSFSPGAIQRYGITNGRRKVPAVPRHFPKATCSVFSRLKKDKSIKSWDPTNLNALSGLNDSHVTGFSRLESNILKVWKMKCSAYRERGTENIWVRDVIEPMTSEILIGRSNQGNQKWMMTQAETKCQRCHEVLSPRIY